MKISELYIYPVKSLGGIKLQVSEITERGLKYDRRWMIVDKNNRFITQRTHPMLSLIDVKINESGFVLSGRPTGNTTFLPFEISNGNKEKVAVWDDNPAAFLLKNEAAGFISEILGEECRLCFMPDDERRSVQKTQNSIVSFADAYPYLIIGQSSLDDLNSRGGMQMDIKRFRPNFVFTGGTPYDEDEWQRFTIGNLHFRGIKPCSRCSIPSIDPETGEKSEEPLRTLSKYRKSGNKVYFGMNLIGEESSGIIRAGDEILVSERKDRS